MSVRELARIFFECLNDVVPIIISDRRNPVIADANIGGYRLRLVVYLFCCTNPPGGRPSGEYKINICVPNQSSRQQGNFDYDAGFVLLVGYVEAMDVFVLWDAYKYRNFAFKSNTQVRVETLLNAMVDGIAMQDRPKKGFVKENVICCTSCKLVEAILLRYKQHEDEFCKSSVIPETQTDIFQFLWSKN